MATTQRLPALIALAVALGGFVVTPVAAQETVSHPGDGFATIQAAVDAAGCGGTVLLAAGTYNERVIAPCGVRIIGAGAGATALDGTGLAEPFISSVLGLGGSPFEPAPFTGLYEVSSLTLRAGDGAPVIGLGVGWAENVDLHDLAIEGFSRGIAIASSIDGAIHDVRVTGPGSNPHQNRAARCIALFEFGLFLDRLPHMTGWSLTNNLLEDCAVGIDLQNNLGASIANNTIERTWIGINLLGSGDTAVHHNFIAHSRGPSAFGFPPAGMSLTNANASDIHHNLLCEDKTGIRYDGLTADAFGFPTSRDNRIHHNTFSGNGQDIGFNDAMLGPGNVTADNTIAPDLACAP